MIKFEDFFSHALGNLQIYIKYTHLASDQT